MSVGPTRGPVQRPSLERDVDELFQRVEDLERNRPGGDYVFVDQQSGNGVGSFAFDVPRDARHLVLEGWIATIQPFGLTLNGDTGSNYNTLRHTIVELDGVVTATDDSTGLTGSVAFGIQGVAKFSIHIPYARQVVAAPIRVRREMFIDYSSWDHDATPHEWFYSIHAMGLWYGDAGVGNDAPAIDTIEIAAGGTLNGFASLYKIL